MRILYSDSLISTPEPYGATTGLGTALSLGCHVAPCTSGRGYKSNSRYRLRCIYGIFRRFVMLVLLVYRAFWKPASRVGAGDEPRRIRTRLDVDSEARRHVLLYLSAIDS
jgi:hypothetical protein